MKNLLIYINDRKWFNKENEIFFKIQIDNSLELGWKPKDIVFIANFDYEYNGVKSLLVPDNICCEGWEKSTKTMATIYLFDNNLIHDDIYWCHDLDAWQLEPISEEELDLNKDVGFCDYGRKPMWQLGSYFFKNTAGDIFRDIANRVKPGYDLSGHEYNDEYALLSLTYNNINGINNRIKRMNITYDFGMRKIELCYQKANKPLKVLHFYPYLKSMNTLKIAMYGKNRINKPLMNERLIKIFKKYGIK